MNASRSLKNAFGIRSPASQITRAPPHLAPEPRRRARHEIAAQVRVSLFCRHSMNRSALSTRNTASAGTSSKKSAFASTV